MSLLLPCLQIHIVADNAGGHRVQRHVQRRRSLSTVRSLAMSQKSSPQGGTDIARLPIQRRHSLSPSIRRDGRMMGRQILRRHSVPASRFENILSQRSTLRYSNGADFSHLPVPRRSSFSLSPSTKKWNKKLYVSLTDYSSWENEAPREPERDACSMESRLERIDRIAIDTPRSLNVPISPGGSMNQVPREPEEASLSTESNMARVNRIPPVSTRRTLNVPISSPLQFEAKEHIQLVPASPLSVNPSSGDKVAIVVKYGSREPAPRARRKIVKKKKPRQQPPPLIKNQTKREKFVRDAVETRAQTKKKAPSRSTSSGRPPTMQAR